jgi:hypothetical protein
VETRRERELLAENDSEVSGGPRFESLETQDTVIKVMTIQL